MPQASFPIPSRDDLKELRDFLVPLWIAWGENSDRPVTDRGEGMCRFSSAFLLRVLGRGWRLDGGFPDVWDFAAMKSRPRASGGGFFDGHRWQAHHWVVRGDVIIDLTASQFGGDDIIVTTAGDPRFRSTFVSRVEIDEALRDVRARAANWSELWFGREVDELPRVACLGMAG